MITKVKEIPPASLGGQLSPIIELCGQSRRERLLYGFCLNCSGLLCHEHGIFQSSPRLTENTVCFQGILNNSRRRGGLLLNWSTLFIVVVY